MTGASFSDSSCFSPSFSGDWAGDGEDGGGWEEKRAGRDGWENRKERKRLTMIHVFIIRHKETEEEISKKKKKKKRKG